MTKPIDLDRLTTLLAELLGGSFVEAEEQSTEPDSAGSEQGVSTFDALSQTAPVYSTMAQQNPKFEAIAKQFVVRLEEKIQEMDQCAEEADFSSLAKHAHWLKGSGGTVGFTEFVEPAKELEEAAKQTDAQRSVQALGIIKNIKSRISFDHSSEQNTEDSNENVSQLTELRHVPPKLDPAIESKAAQVDTDSAEGLNPVVCSLPMHNPRFRGIVERFIPRMDEQIEAIKAAIDTDSFEELAMLAHWLKGSGGNVGYDGFTHLAVSLESGAKQHDREQIAEDFDAILSYSKRVRRGWEQLEPLDKSA